MQCNITGDFFRGWGVRGGLHTHQWALRVQWLCWRFTSWLMRISINMLFIVLTVFYWTLIPLLFEMDLNKLRYYFDSTRNITEWLHNHQFHSDMVNSLSWTVSFPSSALCQFLCLCRHSLFSWAVRLYKSDHWRRRERLSGEYSSLQLNPEATQRISC